MIVEGELRQIGAPGELVAEPSDPFVASFTGANLLHGYGERSAGVTRVRLLDGTVVTTADDADGDSCSPSTRGTSPISTVPPNDSAMNLIERAHPRQSPSSATASASRSGPVSAEITADSLHRLGLEVGQPAYASFKATGTQGGRQRPPDNATTPKGDPT